MCSSVRHRHHSMTILLCGTARVVAAGCKGSVGSCWCFHSWAQPWQGAHALSFLSWWLLSPCPVPAAPLSLHPLLEDRLWQEGSGCARSGPGPAALFTHWRSLLGPSFLSPSIFLQSSSRRPCSASELTVSPCAFVLRPSELLELFTRREPRQLPLAKRHLPLVLITHEHNASSFS